MTREETVTLTSARAAATQRQALVFLVDDDADLRRLVSVWLQSGGYKVQELESGEACIEALGRTTPSVVLLDLNMPGQGGAQALRTIKARHLFLPVVVLTVEREVETVVSVMQLGAYDFLTKPLARNKLLTTVGNATEQHRMALRLAELERQVAGESLFGIVGSSSEMRELGRQLERLAATDVAVYIQGESGTGKELVARAIHERSGRRDGPFVALNCAAIPESLQESELFGHERGSFTGADAKHIGKFEQAQGGTLFLDEVAELSPSLQSKLLRVLQERRLQRVGGVQDVEVDFRLLAATHRRLLDEVHAGRFREDLYFRIVVFELEVPPLRERGGDIPLLVDHFLRRFAVVMGVPVPKVTEEAMQLLCSYRWPGNVRELENAVQRALVSCSDGQIVPVDLPPTLRLAVAASDNGGNRQGMATGGSKVGVADLTKPLSAEPRTLAAIERQAIVAALARCGGNRSRAASELGIGRTTLYRKLQHYGIDAG